jgi:hypothetical protein
MKSQREISKNTSSTKSQRNLHEHLLLWNHTEKSPRTHFLYKITERNLHEHLLLWSHTEISLQQTILKLTWKWVLAVNKSRLTLSQVINWLFVPANSSQKQKEGKKETKIISLTF